MLSWVHVLEWRAAVTPDAVALTDDGGGELTYAGLAAAMEREAAGYAAAGVRPGDVVPVIARNQVGWVTAMFGLVRADALPAAVNWRLAAPEVTALLELMRASAVVSDADCAGLAKQALAGLAAPEPAQLDTAGLIDWAHQRLAGFKCPTGVSVVAQLPATPPARCSGPRCASRSGPDETGGSHDAS